MLNIYYGRENLNKEKFIFDNIKGKTLLIVPDQFTLQAERDAFFYLKTESILDLEVVSISRLGAKILKETGGDRDIFINKYGRHMLLAKIMKECRRELKLYGGQENKPSFITMVNDFISEMKQYGATPEVLADIAQKAENDTFLKHKMEDVLCIYRRYEEEIEGKYTDTEDHVDMFAAKIPLSKKIKDASVWVEGFDYFTPKNLKVIGKLAETAKDVNIVLTYPEDISQARDPEVFTVTEKMMIKLEQISNDAAVRFCRTKIGSEYAYSKEGKAQAILHIEKELYSIPARPFKETRGITLLHAANIYAEAESAAVQVLHLVRDKGMAYNEISVICNDLETRGPIAVRTFAQYGIDLFMDKKRNLLESLAVNYIMALMDIVRMDYRSEEVFRLLKTGLTSFDDDTINDLENYCIKYKIRGGFWKRPFVLGELEYGKERLEKLESVRSTLIGELTEFQATFKKAKTAENMIRVLYGYLVKTAELPDKLKRLMERQEEMGLGTQAEQTAQVWNLVVDIFDQLVEVTGGEEMKIQDLAALMESGFEAVEIGLLPPTADGLVMGTMQRSRNSRIKAMVVMGANEGILPGNMVGETILSEDEKQRLFEKDIEICKMDRLRAEEEKIAIYRNLVKAEKELWVSYSSSDIEGGEAKPSQIFIKLQKIFPELEVEKDIFNRDTEDVLIEAENSALGNLTGVLSQETLKSPWKELLLWYDKNNRDDLNKVIKGLVFTNREGKVGEKLVDMLFRNRENELLSLSPSRLERYSRCPFSHLIAYGLRPEERRIYEMGSREIGDIYHKCLMGLSKELTKKDVDITDEASPWMTVRRERCDEIVDSILAEEAVQYREGLLNVGSEEKYRQERLKEICREVGWQLIGQVRKGAIKSIAFEERFGRNGRIPPVEIDLDGKKAVIEGIIDRLDILPGGKVKIIDYKTGKEKFSADDAKKGWKLQLMIYLKAAQEKDREPAGAFYFLIGEPDADITGQKGEPSRESIEAGIRKQYKMDGVMVNEPAVIDSIDNEIVRYSEIIPVRDTAKGRAGTGQGKLLTAEEFKELQDQVDYKIEELVKGLISGDISIHPKKTKDMSACTFCQYKGICKFDISFEGCKYESI